jgi:hypothetical protein
LVLGGDLNDLLDTTADDVWSYIWGSPIYSSVKAYKHLIGSRQVHPCYSWLWKASAQKKAQNILLVTFERSFEHMKHLEKEK